MKSKFTPDAALPRLAVGGSALLLAMQAAAQAAPQSVSSVSACLGSESTTVFVCSTKELSNVVLQCGSGYVKFDDDAEEPDEDGLGGTLPIADSLDPDNPHAGTFSCPDGSSVSAVFVKSGSGFNTDTSITGLPRGSGALVNPQSCDVAPIDCPNPDAEEDEEESGDEGGE